MKQLNQTTLQNLLSSIFKLLNIDKKIANKILSDPQMKKQVINLRNSFQKVKEKAEFWEEQTKKQWNY